MAKSKIVPRKTASRKTEQSKSPARSEQKLGGKQKTIRDSFNMPKHDYALIAELKKKALAHGIEVKKSGLLRAGLRLLAALDDNEFRRVAASVPALKAGRPTGKSGA